MKLKDMLAVLVAGLIYLPFMSYGADDLPAIQQKSRQGDAFAQLKLGAFYQLGMGVLQDYAQAYAWFNLAAAQGLEGAAECRAIVMKEMTPTQIEEGQRLSREYSTKFLK